MARPTLRQQAYGQILAKIESGDLPKGAVTSEVHLARELDMSRTPVRAALQQLELEGFVRIASKHGVLVLDSSSQRIGDLLEVVASMALFSVGSAHVSRERGLKELSRELAERFQALGGGAYGASGGGSGHEDATHSFNAGPGDLIAFEHELLGRLISLNNNAEMANTYRNATSRLYWSRNDRRWHAPYRLQAQEQVAELIRAVGLNFEAYRLALFDYLRLLKMTWQ
ncbi:GntR family transcriptional regulator [Cohnella fermenti]|nr:GntR family transcriptional regulator [Cohnella fermenti]